jgi:hypothetical protein
VSEPIVAVISEDGQTAVATATPSSGGGDSGDDDESDANEGPVPPAVLYWVSDEDAERPFDETTLRQIVAQRLREWFDEQRETLVVVSDMSASEENWINNRVISRIIGG